MMNFLYSATRIILAFVFAFSSMTHLKHPFMLLDHILAYRLATGSLASLAVGVALLLPIVEFLLAAVMLSKMPDRVVGMFNIPVLSTFLIVQLSALVRGLNIDCGCFGGVIQRKIGWESLLLIVAMLIACVLLAFSRRRSQNNKKPKKVATNINMLAPRTTIFLWSLAGVLALIIPVRGFSQTSLPPLPDSTDAFIHVQNTRAIAEELAWLRRLAVDDQRFHDLIVNGENPLCTIEEFQQVIENIEELENALRTIHSLTFAVRKLVAAPEYLIVIKVDGSDLPDLVQLYNALQNHFTPNSGSSELNNDFGGQLRRESSEQDLTVDLSGSSPGNSTEGLPDLIRAVGDWLKRFAPNFLEIESGHVAYSNSKEWLEWTDAASKGQVQTNGLADTRRFKRSLNALSYKADDVAVVWFVPEILFPIWDSSLTPEQLRRYGYEELVGAAGSIRVTNQLSDEGRRLDFKLAVPFTVPETGIVSLWQSYEPIAKLPSLASYLDKSEDCPWVLKVQNQNRQKYFELLEAVYQSRGETQLLQERLQAEAQWHPDLDNYLEYFNGQWVRMTMFSNKPKAQYYSLDFLATNNLESTLKYARHSANLSERDSQFPKPEIEINGFPAWFRSARDNLQMLRDGDDDEISLEDRHLVRNMGMALTSQWLIQGDESQVREYLGSVNEESSPATKEINHFGFDLHDVFAAVKPSWIEYHFPGARLRENVTSLRIMWLSHSMGRNKAREMVKGWNSDMKISESMPLRSRSDRVFGVADWFVYQLMSRYSSDVKMFTSRESHFEWHWFFLGKTSD